MTLLAHAKWIRELEIGFDQIEYIKDLMKKYDLCFYRGDKTISVIYQKELLMLVLDDGSNWILGSDWDYEKIKMIEKDQ